MSFSIQINHENRLIQYKHSGLIRKEDIGKAWEEFLGMKEFTQLNFNLLSDYTEARFDFLLGDIEQIVDFLESIQGIVRDKKQALVVADPTSTALSLLFGPEVFQRSGFKVRIYSTMDAALRWLLL